MNALSGLAFAHPWVLLLLLLLPLLAWLKGKFEFVKTFTFRRGVPGGDSLYAEQESILIVCKKIAH